MDELKHLEEIRNWEHPPWYGRDQFKERVTLTFLENQKGLFHNLMTHFRLPVKLWTIFGPCRKLHIPPSRWTQSQTLLAERRIIPYSTQIHWRNHSYLYEFGCQARESALMIIGTLMALETCLILGQVSLDLFYWKKNLQTDVCGPGRDWRGKQLTSRPDHLWPELWKSMGKHAKLKEKQKRSEEKIHLENARKLRGICFIDPEDKEFKETIKNARKKLETSVAPAMPCKIAKNCGSGASNKNKTKLACILEANESTRMRMGNSEPHHHEDHIAGKGENSFQHDNLVHTIYSFASSYENSSSESSGGQGMGKIGENFGVEPDESQKQERSDRWSKDVGRESSFGIINGLLSFEECWIGSKAPKVQRSSCTPRWHCERWFRITRSIYWTGLISITSDGRKGNGCYCSTTWLWRTSNWRNIGIHPAKKGGYSKTTYCSRIRMCRCMATSSKT